MPVPPFAVKRLIPPGANDPRINARIGILHVDAGNAESLYNYFNGRSGGIESHGHIKRSGLLEAYRDTAFQADANHKANDFATSWETQGFGEGIWSPEQLATIKRIMLWSVKADGIPLRKVDTWNDPKGGWGYHIMFGAPGPWTPVSKACPGKDRIEQFHDILVPWLKRGGKEVAPPRPTPAITAALQAKTPAERKAALKRIIRHSSNAQKAKAASAWLEAIRAGEAARAIAIEARQDLRDLEVRV